MPENRGYGCGLFGGENESLWIILIIIVLICCCGNNSSRGC